MIIKLILSFIVFLSVHVESSNNINNVNNFNCTQLRNEIFKNYHNINNTKEYIKLYLLLN